MYPHLYKAAMKGNVDDLTGLLDQLNVQRTRNGNTVLHVATQFNQPQLVAEILGKRPLLLREANIKGETPLHIAAREGLYGIVQLLIDTAKKLDQEAESGGGAAVEILRATDENQDTALHMAVRKRHNLEVVRLLTSEDPEFEHRPNNAEETPLYLAAERGYASMVSEILQNCTSPAYGGPSRKTALHAAAISDVTGECTKRLLNSDLMKVHNQDPIKLIDSYGWTPIHYAAYYGFETTVGEILARDQTAGYLTAGEDDKNTAIHIAAAKGHVSVMKELLLHCPDCWELVNSKGQNILHIAVEIEERIVIKFILKQSWISHLINQKDLKGITPFHLINQKDLKGITPFHPLAASEIQVRELISHPSAAWRALKNMNLNRQVGMSAEDEIKNEVDRVSIDYNMTRPKLATGKTEKETPGDITKVRETELIVATLITTVTFAAAFTLPGGYNGNDGPDQGMAVLVRKAAFKAFVVTNAIALTFSTSAVYIHLSSSVTKNNYAHIYNHDVAAMFIICAILAMMIAFITGSYAALPNSAGLATAVCVIGSYFFLIYLPLWKECWEVLQEKIENHLLEHIKVLFIRVGIREEDGLVD